MSWLQKRLRTSLGINSGTGSKIYANQVLWQISILLGGSSLSWLATANPALAHHAMGGALPANAFEGFVSGLAHPVVGFDHFVFVVSLGLLFAVRRQGFLIPIAFVLAALGGTGLHLMEVTLPGAEWLIAASVVLSGLLLTVKDRFNPMLIAGLAAIAGVCHGYAYGEAIVGAETAPLTAYLVGFTTIQLVVAMSAFGVGRAILNRAPQRSSATSLHPAGWVICGIGLALLAAQVNSAVFPGM